MAKGLRGGRNDEEKARRWRGEVDAWRRSGGSQVAFCRRRGLRRDQFVYWKRRLEELDGRRDGGAMELVEVPALVQLAGGEEKPSAGVALIGWGTWRVEVERGFDGGTLGRVLAVLEARR